MGTVIIGATSIEQLRDNVAACAAPLDPEVEEALDEIYLQHGDANMQD
jgi:aryl-alcohol dehydrogenase-like predicted oxidoreductase